MKKTHENRSNIRTKDDLLLHKKLTCLAYYIHSDCKGYFLEKIFNFALNLPKMDKVRDEYK